MIQSLDAVPEVLDRNLLALVTSADQERIRRSPVPVLLPAQLRQLGELYLDFGRHYFSATMRGPDRTISLLGSRLAYSYDKKPKVSTPVVGTVTIRGLRAFASGVSGGIWNASWQQYGASYVLSTECSKPGDHACGSADFTIGLANGLRYVGGGTDRSQPTSVPEIIRRRHAQDEKFTYQPPGILKPGSGTGREDINIYAPGIRFPIEKKPAYANSQVYNPGGLRGGGGHQCAASNYSYPWWDDFCETRSRPALMCPTGEGHQGQDIRPATCQKDRHYVVAAIDGTVTTVGGYSVFVTARDGTQYRYLHMSSVVVKMGDALTKGQRIGKVSNVFTVPTTYHLHFEILQNLKVDGYAGYVFVPPYASLIEAYSAL